MAFRDQCNVCAKLLTHSDLRETRNSNTCADCYQQKFFKAASIIATLIAAACFLIVYAIGCLIAQDVSIENHGLAAQYIYPLSIYIPYAIALYMLKKKKGGNNG